MPPAGAEDKYAAASLLVSALSFDELTFRAARSAGEISLDDMVRSLAVLWPGCVLCRCVLICADAVYLPLSADGWDMNILGAPA